ncbi:hypothetical protein [Azospirillum sp.]|uniref:hypothetical protein n=1 Tax=Azospirillum sp. TaxID=34012 RepID=UPI002D742E62|nr:hypothetical protein [Azospirillum sp.]HYD65585.1 hypothetical protein [Azospirillum sp.]
MATDKKQTTPRGEQGVLGNKQEFKKDEAQGRKPGTDEQAKDEIGHMGEATKRNTKAKDVR